MINTLGNNILNPSVYSNCQKYASYRVVSNKSRVNIYIFTHIHIHIYNYIYIYICIYFNIESYEGTAMKKTIRRLRRPIKTFAFNWKYIHFDEAVPKYISVYRCNVSIIYQACSLWGMLIPLFSQWTFFSPPQKLLLNFYSRGSQAKYTLIIYIVHCCASL